MLGFLMVGLPDFISHSKSKPTLKLLFFRYFQLQCQCIFQIDESGEIRATGFKEQCDKFYNMLEVGKVYLISSCVLKPANKQVSNIKTQWGSESRPFENRKHLILNILKFGFHMV